MKSRAETLSHLGPKIGSFESHLLREKCPNAELFLVRIQAECGKIRTRNNSVFRHFSRSD